MEQERNGKNGIFKPATHFHSQLNALRGLKMIVKNERNFRIHLLATMCVIFLGFVLKFSYSDWIAISLLIGLVLISEAFNSVVEALADTISQEYRVNIKYAKDVSAGAVLISALVSVIAGTIIISPYILKVIQSYLS